MRTEVLVPDLGVDSDQPVTVSVWLAEEGEEVFEGDRLVELLAGSVVFDLPAPASGRLAQVAAEDQVVRGGDMLGVIESEEAEKG